MPTALTNTSPELQCLPYPYRGVLKPGVPVYVRDDISQVINYFNGALPLELRAVQVPLAAIPASAFLVEPAQNDTPWKDPVQVATTATLANLLAVASPIDGIALAAPANGSRGSRILVKDTASPDGVVGASSAYNGIYEVASQNADGTFKLVRAYDARTPAQMYDLVVRVVAGTVGAGTQWGLGAVAYGTMVMNTTALTFGSQTSVSGVPGTTVGFFGVTPVARAAAIVQTYSTAARTLPAALTDSSGGTPSATTIPAITTGGAAADQAPTRDAIATLNARVDTVTKVLNALIDDLQAYGLEQ